MLKKLHEDHHLPSFKKDAVPESAHFNLIKEEEVKSESSSDSDAA